MMSRVAHRDFEAMERRRKRAARMFERGAMQADVARELVVSRQSVSRWYAEWRAGGTRALKAAGRAGRMPRLSETQLRQVDRALRRGPRAHGFATDLWSLDRVATVIEAETGVCYHPGHVWKLLRDKCSDGVVSGPPAGRWNATTRRSPVGWQRSGRA